MTSTSSLPRGAPIRAVSEHEVRFRQLFDDQYRELLGYALRRVGSPDDAADVVGETMLVAWRRIDEVPDDGTARLWLYGVARRVIANHRRGQLRRGRLAARLHHSVAEITPDPVALSDATAIVQQGLDALSDDDRELIMLIAWDGLEPPSGILGTPCARAKTRRCAGKVSASRGGG